MQPKLRLAKTTLQSIWKWELDTINVSRMWQIMCLDIFCLIFFLTFDGVELELEPLFSIIPWFKDIKFEAIFSCSSNFCYIGQFAKILSFKHPFSKSEHVGTLLVCFKKGLCVETMAIASVCQHRVEVAAVAYPVILVALKIICTLFMQF